MNGEPPATPSDPSPAAVAPAADAAARRDVLVDAAVLAALFAALAAWTWGKWADPLIDFGRELYVPWRLAAGERLYADVAYLNGPLSPYANALLFRLFGARVWTLFAANLALLAIAVALAWHLLRRAWDRTAALVGGALFLVVFAFGRELPVGSHDWAAPYSHEMTHGSLLALAALAFLGRFLRTGGRGALAAAGLCLGLVALGKPELLIALGPALVLAVAIGTAGRALRRRVRDLLLLAAAALVPVAVAAVALAPGLGLAGALRGVAGAWPETLGGRAAALPFYRVGAGLDAPLLNAVRMLLAAAVFAGAAGVVALASRLASRLALLVALAPALVVAAFHLVLPWTYAFRGLPLLALLALGLAAWRALCAPATARTPAALVRLAFVAYGLLLLTKMALAARVFHYGFALALPATLTLGALLASDLPRAVAARGGRPGVARAGAVALLAVVAFVQLEISGLELARVSEPVGGAGDRFLADPRGRLLEQARQLLDQEAAPTATVAVLPDGAMLGFLLRRPGSTPYVTFLPGELMFFGEDAIVARFAARPPDWIVLTNRGAQEHGYRFLGDDYGRALLGWVRQHYRVVGGLADPALAGQPFSAYLFLRPREVAPGGRELGPTGAIFPRLAR